MRAPIFKPKYHLESVPGDGVFLLTETESFVLEGYDLELIIPLIDGSRTVEEIVASVYPALSPAQAYNALELLKREGHIQEADFSMPSELGAFWSELNVDTNLLPELFSRSPVSVISLGGGDTTPLENILRSFGVHISKNGVLAIVVVDDYLNPALEKINTTSLKMSFPWLILKPSGINLWFGPLFVPGRTACWRCLESRLRNNREIESFIERKTGKQGPFPIAKSQIGVTRFQAFSMAAVQIVRWIVNGGNESLESKINVSETLSFQFHTHQVVRRPQCPTCGNPTVSRSLEHRVSFQEHRKSSNSDGGDRNEPPEVTFNRFSHHVSPITGVVQGLFPSPWHNAGPLRVYTAGHNFALKNDSLYFLKDGLRTHSSGKGRTDSQARTSALCEALERYSGVFQGDEQRRLASFNELKDAAIHPNKCMQFSDTQYHEREQWLARGSRFQVVPLPFDETKMLEWSPVYSVSQNCTKYLPTSYLYYNYPSPPSEFFCWADSNGNAAGVTFEDACLQGLLELIERDGVCIWWYNRASRPQVDLESFGDPYFAELREFYREKNREFWVLDLTNDIGIPVFAALNRRIGGPTEDIIMGFGAHLNGRIALTRAITEMNQFIPAVLTVLPDGTTAYQFNDSDALQWWKHATIENQPYLKGEGVKGCADYSLPCDSGILGQLRHCIGLLENKGMEVLLLDQTRPDIGLNVVKVIVPGLRHFWARFGPGRMYDVPVALGWTSEATSEAALNPTPMFL